MQLNIDAIFEELLNNERAQLLSLFNSGKSGYIEYEPKKIIGVNPTKETKIVVQVGVWYLGEI